MINRVQTIKEKGFSMGPTIVDNNIPANNEFHNVDFSKIRVGIKSLDDATYQLSDLKTANNRLADKQAVLQAIDKGDLATMREISNFFYKTSGIYNRLCRYLAYMYCYDWFITPYISDKTMSDSKVLDNFYKVLNFLDNFGIKKFCGEVALKVLRYGCYYGYLIPREDRVVVQELPQKYCRSRFTSADGRPVIEFNMKYFDDAFANTTQRAKMLKLFPEEFAKGYKEYKNGKLVPDFQGDTQGWYLLDIEHAIKFNINGDDFPALISVVPTLIDLDAMQGVDRKKLEQQLLKIIIQKMPLDKNGDLVFDVDEARQLHNNAVNMLGKAIGIDVLTTFADVDVADMASTGNANATDEGMDRAKAAVYDQAGVSQLQFNSEGNIALNNSILNDEASMYNLVQQFEQFINNLLKPYNKRPKKLFYRAQMLKTTIYNYKELAKLYKEQVALGYSKMLPPVALGESQSSDLANAYFENDLLNLAALLIPPMQSSTMNAEALSETIKGGALKEDSEAGRPEKEASEKSDKTLANEQSMG